MWVVEDARGDLAVRRQQSDAVPLIALDDIDRIAVLAPVHHIGGAESSDGTQGSYTIDLPARSDGVLVLADDQWNREFLDRVAEQVLVRPRIKHGIE